MSEQDAPREVWLQFYAGRLGQNIVASDRHPHEVHDNGKPAVRYVRADLAPSAQPAEPSARERRLAEAVVYLLGDIDEVPEEKREDEIEAIAAEARAVLASPEAPAKAWEKWIQVRQSGMFAGEWTVNLQIPGVLATVLERTNDAGRALRLAEQFAAALGLEVRR